MKPLLVYFIVACCSVLGAIGQIMFSKASVSINLSKPLELITNYSLIIGLLCYGIATIVYIIMLKYGEVSVLYPIIALSYIWVMLMSSIMLNQEITILKGIGVFLIISGIACIVR